MLAKRFPTVDPNDRLAHDFIDKFHRHTFLTDIMVSAYGFLVGSLISQHYGFGSGMLDATTSIEVAAFFATHSFPEYNLFSGTAAESSGVIYRFANLSPNLSPATAFQTDYYRAPGTVQTESLLTALEADISVEESLRTLRQCFQMRTCPDVGERRYDLIKFPRGTIAGSRIGRQKAIVVIPDEIRKSVPISTSHPVHGTRTIGPSLTWECQQSIEDLHNRPNGQCFYFRHSHVDPTPQLNPGYLWPNDNDYFLLAIAYLFASGLGFHIHPGVVLPQRLDLIDPGHGIISTEKLAASAEEYLSRCDESALSESLNPYLRESQKVMFHVFKAGVLSYRGHVTGDGVAIEEALKHCRVARKLDKKSVSLVALEMLLHEAVGRHSDEMAVRDEALNMLIQEGIAASNAFQYLGRNYLYPLYTKRFSRDFAHYFYELYQST
jgi:hypothetical protein